MQNELSSFRAGILNCQAQLKTKKEVIIADTEGVEVW